MPSLVTLAGLSALCCLGLLANRHSYYIKRHSTLLIGAIKEKRPHLTQVLIKMGIGINSVDSYNEKPLMWAIQKDQTEIALAILDCIPTY